MINRTMIVACLTVVVALQPACLMMPDLSNLLAEIETSLAQPTDDPNQPSATTNDQESVAAPTDTPSNESESETPAVEEQETEQPFDPNAVVVPEAARVLPDGKLGLIQFAYSRSARRPGICTYIGGTEYTDTEVGLFEVKQGRIVSVMAGNCASWQGPFPLDTAVQVDGQPVWIPNIRQLTLTPLDDGTQGYILEIYDFKTEVPTLEMRNEIRFFPNDAEHGGRNYPYRQETTLTHHTERTDLPRISTSDLAPAGGLYACTRTRFDPALPLIPCNDPNYDPNQ